MFTREYLDSLIDRAKAQGSTDVDVEGDNADTLVNALGDRIESLTGDAHTLGFSGRVHPNKYTLTVLWCGS